MRIVAVLSVILLLAGLSFSVNVNSCVNITSSNVYDLNASLSGAPNDATAEFGYPAQACIKIYSPDVVLDCHGFAITGPGGFNTTAGILINGSATPNVTVQNCAGISSYAYGVLVMANGTTIRNNTAFNNVNYGFDTFLASGNVLDNNTAYGNAFGFFIDEGTGNNITGNNAFDNLQRGYEIYLGSGNLFMNDVATNSGRGYSVRDTSGNTFLDSNASGNNLSGFYLDGGSSNNLTGNIAAGNCGIDAINNGSSVTGGDGRGFFLNGSSGNYLDSNTAHDNCGGAGGNGSVVGGNGGDGYGFLLDPVSGNTLVNNVAYNNLGGVGGISTGVIGGTGGAGIGFGISSSDGNSLSGNTAYGNCGGTATSGTAIGGNGGSGEGFSILNGAGNTLASNTAHDNCGGTGGAAGSIAGEGGFGIGFSLTSNSGSTTSNNLTNNTAYSNVGGIGGVGGSSVGGPGEGFFLTGVSGNLLDGNVAHDNCGETGSGGFFGGRGAGFFLFTGADGNTLTNNYAFNNCGGAGTTSPGDGEGFSIDGSSSNIISGNNASGNQNNGFEMFDSFGNAMNGNIAHDNPQSGFTVGSGGSNILDNNTAFNNGMDGFMVGFFEIGTTLSNATAWNNAKGIEIAGANDTVLAGGHLFANNPDFQVNGTGITVSMDKLDFDNPAGNFTDHTSVSLSDVVDSAYSINWSAQPAPLPGSEISFENKYVNITNLTSNVSIDTLTFNWLDSESNKSGYNEGAFRLFDYNGSWRQLPPSPNSGANTLTLLNVDSFSVFAILQVPLASGGGNGGGTGGATPALSIGFNASDDVATVTSGGSAVAGATVKVDGTAIGTTDSNGQIAVPGCGQGVTLDALMAGYTAASASVTLMSCTAPPACASDQNCTSQQACVAGACAAVSCANGTVVDHACVVPQNNTQNQTQCTAPSCCTSSGQCLDTQACVTPSGAPASASTPGSCLQVSGQCGYAAGHAFVPYNYTCGTEPGCPSCPAGQSCVAHQCASNDISCPSGGVVGGNQTCVLTQNGQACGPDLNCSASVTAPDGKQSTLVPDSSGRVTFPLTLKGSYEVALLKDGTAVKQVSVAASAPSAPSEGGKPTQAPSDNSWMLWLLLIVVIVVGVLYWRGRKR